MKEAKADVPTTQKVTSFSPALIQLTFFFFGYKKFILFPHYTFNLILLFCWVVKFLLIKKFRNFAFQQFTNEKKLLNFLGDIFAQFDLDFNLFNLLFFMNNLIYVRLTFG
jgi:hypothetical protein